MRHGPVQVSLPYTPNRQRGNIRLAGSSSILMRKRHDRGRKVKRDAVAKYERKSWKTDNRFLSLSVPLGTEHLYCAATGTAAATRLIRVRAKYCLYSTVPHMARTVLLPFRLLVTRRVIRTRRCGATTLRDAKHEIHISKASRLWLRDTLLFAIPRGGSADDTIRANRLPSCRQYSYRIGIRIFPMQNGDTSFNR